MGFLVSFLPFKSKFTKLPEENLDNTHVAASPLKRHVALTRSVSLPFSSRASLALFSVILPSYGGDSCSSIPIYLTISRVWDSTSLSHSRFSLLSRAPPSRSARFTVKSSHYGSFSDEDACSFYPWTLVRWKQR